MIFEISVTFSIEWYVYYFFLNFLKKLSREPIRRRILSTSKDGVDIRRFIKFAATRFVQSNSTQNQICRTHQELSIDINFIEKHTKSKAK